MTLNNYAVQESGDSAAFSLRDLVFCWKPSGAQVLNIARLEIARGEKVFLYGPSGSGKTTLLNLLTGIIRPQQGQIQVLGHNLTAMSQRQRDKFRARHIGVIFQQFNLIPYLSLSDNVLLGAHFAGIPKPLAAIRAQQLLNELGLVKELYNCAAHQLSVGQQQRGAVARALIIQPEIIIADEPTSALDSDSRDIFIELLLRSADAIKASVLFVSHDKSLQPYFSRALDIRDLLPMPALEFQGAVC